VIYHLPSGQRVRVTRDGDDLGQLNFEEYTFSGPEDAKVDGDRYSLRGFEAEMKMAELSTADAVRFGQQYSRTAAVIQSLVNLPARVEDPYATPHPDSLPFDVHRLLGEYRDHVIDLPTVTRNLISRISQEVHGEVAHHLSDLGRDTTIADLAEFYGDLARGE
jgi:hypothetical protein